MKKIFLLLAFLSVCVQAKVYKIATSPDYPPFEYVTEAGFAGVDMSLLKEIAKRAGFEYEVVGMDFGTIETSLQSKSVDMAISNITVTPERKAKFEVSRGYFNDGNFILIAEGNDELSTINDLAGKKIAVVNQESTQAEVAKKLGASQIIANNSIVNAIIQVKSGKSAAMIVDTAGLSIALDSRFEFLSELDKRSLSFLADLDTGKKLHIFHIYPEPTESVILFQKGIEPDLVQKVNTAILEMKADGTIKRILSDYGIKY